MRPSKIIPYLTKEDLRESARGVLVASPVLLFPFSRLYTIGFILLLIVAVLELRRPIEWVWPLPAPYRPLLWGLLAIAGPVVVTCFALPLLGLGLELLWLRNLLTIVTAGLFSWATIRVLGISSRARQLALALIVAAIIFWLLDGLVQFTLGRDIFGIPLQENGRLGIFFSNPKSFGYFVPFFSVYPVFWCLRLKRGVLYSLSVLLVTGVITLASGSRYGMVSFGLLVVVYTFLIAQGFSRTQRFGFLLGLPLFLLSFVSVVFQLNLSFRSRLLQTLSFLANPSYQSLDYTLNRRLEIWQHSWNLIQSNFIFGIGPGQFRTAVATMLLPEGYYYNNKIAILHAHQVLLEIGLGTGVVGVICFLFYYRKICLIFWERRSAWRDPSCSMGLAGLLNFLLFWFPLGSQKNFYGSEQLFITFYFLALAFGLLFSDDRISPPKSCSASRD